MKNKLITLLIVTMSLGIVFTGCGDKKQSPSMNGVSINGVSGNAASFDFSKPVYDHEYAASTVLFKVEDIDITVEDYNLYLLQYLFNNSVDASTINDATKQQIMSETIDELKLENVEYKLAMVTDGVNITEEDKAASAEIADRFINYFGEDFLNYYGISTDKVQEMFIKQAYIERLKQKTILDFTEDYKEQFEKDYKDVSFYSVYYVLFPAIKYNESKLPIAGEDGTPLRLTDEERAEQLVSVEEMRAKILENIDNGIEGGDMENLAIEYGVDFASGVEHGYTGAYTEEINEAVDGLENGEISEIIDTEAGYMIARMDNNNDEEFRAYTIDYMATQSANTMYPTVQENWMSASGIGNLAVDTSVLADVPVESMAQVMNIMGYSMTGGTN